MSCLGGFVLLTRHGTHSSIRRVNLPYTLSTVLDEFPSPVSLQLVDAADDNDDDVKREAIIEFNGLYISPAFENSRASWASSVGFIYCKKFWN